MRVKLPAFLFAALAAITPAQAGIFSFEFAFPGSGIADIPGSEELASNQFVTTQITVFNPTRLSLFRLRQTDSGDLLDGLLPPGTDVDLFFGADRFDIVDQGFSFAGQLVGTFTFAGGFINSFGYAFDDGGPQFFYYPELPFWFYIDQTATYDGIGPYAGTSDVIYIRLPGNDGLYRLQAAVPEPASWAMMIVGFGAVGAVARRRVTPAIA